MCWAALALPLVVSSCSYVSLVFSPCAPVPLPVIYLFICFLSPLVSPFCFLFHPFSLSLLSPYPFYPPFRSVSMVSRLRCSVRRCAEWVEREADVVMAGGGVEF